MSIPTLQIPGYHAQPDLNFASLAQLPQLYRRAQQQAARREALSQFGQGPSGRDVVVRLAQADDLQGAMSLANLDRIVSAPDQTDEIKEYNMAVRQGFKGNLLDYKRALKWRDALNAAGG